MSAFEEKKSGTQFRFRRRRNSCLFVTVGRRFRDSCHSTLCYLKHSSSDCLKLRDKETVFILNKSE